MWQQVKGWLGSLDINLDLNRTKLIFGINNESSLSIKNYIILTVKYFIWKTKFLNISLELEDYKHYLKNKLEDKKNACFIQGRESDFEPWLVIYDNIERPCTDISAAPLPTTADPQAQPIATHPPLPPGTPSDLPTIPTGQNTTDTHLDLTDSHLDPTDYHQALQVHQQVQVPLGQVEGQAEQVLVTPMPDQD